MKAAIYCSGPSLERTLTAGTSSGYDLVIAVNHAAIYAAQKGECVHWWVACDAITVRKYQDEVQPSDGIVTDKRGISLIKDDLLCAMDWQWLGANMHGGIVRPSYSYEAALLLAEYLGCTHADCYGVDQEGAAHVCGQEKNKPARWAKEKDRIHDLQNKQREQGFTHERKK